MIKRIWKIKKRDRLVKYAAAAKLAVFLRLQLNHINQKENALFIPTPARNFSNEVISYEVFHYSLFDKLLLIFTLQGQRLRVKWHEAINKTFVVKEANVTLKVFDLRSNSVLSSISGAYSLRLTIR